MYAIGECLVGHEYEARVNSNVPCCTLEHCVHIDARQYLCYDTYLTLLRKLKKALKKGK